ncbi:Hypothetical_protein [Hexamita inflata]|uniref:Hypothetical_protein n=1 Tax=Hexamita inflata TaxID=28002 RepID=A0AA86U135_9EUKA|nr:Hypothetical protein HINF_LOCUS23894 [Hexamita inflata]
MQVNLTLRYQIQKMNYLILYKICHTIVELNSSPYQIQEDFHLLNLFSNAAMLKNRSNEILLLNTKLFEKFVVLNKSQQTVTPERRSQIHSIQASKRRLCDRSNYQLNFKQNFIHEAE